MALQVVRRVRRRIDTTIRVASSPLRAMPDFLILGTQRGGTTGLYRALAAHPDVRPARQKEVHHLDREGRTALRYRAEFPLRSRLVSREGFLTGEATPTYLFASGAPPRAAALVPQVRCIVLLRDPVDRAHAHWRLWRARFGERRSFERCVDEEITTLEGGGPAGRRQPAATSAAQQYLARGLYRDQLVDWFAALRREQFLVLRSEDYFARPLDVYREVTAFLGLTDFVPPAIAERVHSAAGTALDPEVGARARAFFAPHNARLTALLGDGFAWS